MRLKILLLISFLFCAHVYAQEITQKEPYTLILEIQNMAEVGQINPHKTLGYFMGTDLYPDSDFMITLMPKDANAANQFVFQRYVAIHSPLECAILSPNDTTGAHAIHVMVQAGDTTFVSVKMERDQATGEVQLPRWPHIHVEGPLREINEDFLYLMEHKESEIGMGPEWKGESLPEFLELVNAYVEERYNKEKLMLDSLQADSMLYTWLSYDWAEELRLAQWASSDDWAFGYEYFFPETEIIALIDQIVGDQEKPLYESYCSIRYKIFLSHLLNNRAPERVKWDEMQARMKQIEFYSLHPDLDKELRLAAKPLLITNSIIVARKLGRDNRLVKDFDKDYAAWRIKVDEALPGYEDLGYFLKKYEGLRKLPLYLREYVVNLMLETQPTESYLHRHYILYLIESEVLKEYAEWVFDQQ